MEVRLLIPSGISNIPIRLFLLAHAAGRGIASTQEEGTVGTVSLAVVASAGAERTRVWVATISLAILLQVLPVRRAMAENRIDTKLMLYQEDHDRMQIIAPAFLYEQDLSSTLTIKVDGIFNSISGATPTGAPMEVTTIGGTVVIAPSEPEGEADEDGSDEDEEEIENGGAAKARRLNRSYGAYWGKAGATPNTPAPSSGGSSSTTTTSSSSTSQLPTVPVSDERFGVNVGLSKRLERHTVSGGISGSTESDYESLGVSLSDAIDYNQKNTTLILGTAYTHDTIDATTGISGNKNTLDLMAGLSQVLGPKTLLAINLTWSHGEGLLTDPYKIVELNGVLVPEVRPDNRDKQMLFLALTRFVESLNGSAEISSRFYTDTFGISAQTYELAWYQKMGDRFTLRPIVRLYDQTAADFYAVRFEGSPTEYSSDYRLSAMNAFGAGLKGIWKLSSAVSLDLAYDRYEQTGKDSETPDEVYPTANVITAGARIWF